MREDFHWVGTSERTSDLLIRSASGAAKAGADNLRNHDGSPSGPVAVDFNLSKI